MEHIYRDIRISLRHEEKGWHARFWRVTGLPLLLTAEATTVEGDAICLERAKSAVDQFLRYVAGPSRGS